MSLVKVQHKGQVTIPIRLRTQAGIAEGDLIEATFQGGKIVLTPKLVIDRSKFPTADDEYTSAQRRAIDSRLAKGLADIKAGRVQGPFGTAEALIQSLHAPSAKRRNTKATKRNS